MRFDIAALDLRQRRRSLLGYSLGMAVYTLIVVALYPAFKGSSALDGLIRSDPAAAALLGVSGSISSSGGWLNANVYANFFPLVMFLMTIGYGAASVAGQDEEGTLSLLVSLPIARRELLLQKVGTMALQAASLAVAVAICVIVGRSFELTTAVGTIVAASVAMVLMGLDFGLLALAVGACSGRRGTAIGVASAVAAAAYLISSLAPVISWIRPLRYVSPFYWAVGNNQITSGVSAADCGVLLGIGAAMLVFAVLAFRRMEVH